MAVKQDVKLLNENIVRCTVENALLRLIDKYDLKADEIDYSYLIIPQAFSEINY